MRFTITGVDYAPDELSAQVPIRGKILLQFPGPDRSDYHLAQLDRPLAWKKKEGVRGISHVLLAARSVGGVLSPAMRGTPVNIAYVTDQSVLTDSKLDFQKCAYVAIGAADGEEPKAPLPTSGQRPDVAGL